MWLTMMSYPHSTEASRFFTSSNTVFAVRKHVACYTLALEIKVLMVVQYAKDSC